MVIENNLDNRNVITGCCCHFVHIHSEAAITCNVDDCFILAAYLGSNCYEYFSMEKVLSFMLELMIVERWSKMSSESGRKVFMEVVDKFRNSFEFAEEFKN